jgi:hypothetical protein
MKMDALHHRASLGAPADAQDVGKARYDADVLVHVVEESFHVDGDLLGEEELLLVELLSHGVLERLVKELSENDDEGEYDQEEEYNAGWSKKPVFPEGPEEA